jgi:O-antigen/teichoic acid export membrane protein
LASDGGESSHLSNPDERDGTSEPVTVDRTIDRLTSPDVGLVVVRGASLRALAYAVGLGLSVLGSILLLRYLSVDDFGRYMTVAALVAIVAGISEAGISTLGTREIARRSSPADRDRLVSNLLGLRLVLTTLGVAIATAVAIAIGYDRTLVLGTAVMGVGLVLTSAQLTMTLPLAADLRMGRLATAELIKQAVVVAGFAALVALGAALLAFFSVLIVAGLVVLAATPWLLNGLTVSWRPRFDRADWGSLLRLGLPLAVSATIAVLNFRVLVVLASVITTPFETGLLATSFRIVEFLYGLAAVATSVALPVLTASSGNRHRLTFMTRRMTDVALLGSCYLALVVAILARPILGILGGAEYEAAAPVLQIQVFALIPSFLAQTWLVALVAIGRMSSLAIAAASGLVITVGLGALLLEEDGAKGGATAALAGEAALAAVVLLILWSQSPQRPINLGTVWKVACSSLALGTIALLPDSPWLGCLAGTAAFVAIAIATRAVPSELVDAFRRRPTTG